MKYRLKREDWIKWTLQEELKKKEKSRVSEEYGLIREGQTKNQIELS